MFSKRFIDKINEDERESAAVFTSALLAFGKGRYDEALQLISKTEQFTLFLKFFIRQFRSCCLYELNERQMFDNEFKSLYHFLKNNQLSNPRLVNAIETHMKKVKSLFMLKEKFRVNLYEKLDSGKNVNFPWIEQKLKEIYILQQAKI